MQAAADSAILPPQGLFRDLWAARMAFHSGNRERRMLSAANSPWCLIVEDEALIGLALEASLEEAGFRVAGPFMRNAAALAWLESHTPDLALLDVLLKDGPCTPVVRALRARSIPFAIYSGLEPASRPPELAAVPWLEKPVSRNDLASVLLEIAPKPPREGAGSRVEPVLAGARG